MGNRPAVPVPALERAARGRRSSHIKGLWQDRKILSKLGAYLTGMRGAMELRHLRYFIAVAEMGSLTEAAKRRLHTSQPSLSRQIRDLEHQVGVELLSRSVHGVELT